MREADGQREGIEKIEIVSAMKILKVGKASGIDNILK